MSRTRSGAIREMLRGIAAALLLCAVCTGILGGCTGLSSSEARNLCAVFEKRPSWHAAARASESRWGVPVPVLMAIMYKESKFHARARPARTRILWLFPGPRPSSAFGYAQAINETWEEYQTAVNQPARRDDFGDAVDFIGWYCRLSQKRCHISLTDTRRLYLAYHEGHSGFQRGSYLEKNWLLKVADEARVLSDRYAAQYRSCH